MLQSAAYNWVNVLYPWHKARSRIPCFHTWFWDQCFSTRSYTWRTKSWFWSGDISWKKALGGSFQSIIDFHTSTQSVLKEHGLNRGGVSGLAVSSGPLLCILSDLLQWTHQEGGNNSHWLLCLSSLLARITLQIYTELDPEKCFQLLAAGVNLLCWAYWKWTPGTLNKATK